MHSYRTSEVAQKAGIHPNTVRLYETLALIPKAARAKNGYRVFTDFHIRQIEFARRALRVEVLQNGIRRQVIAIIRASACKDFNQAISLTEDYLDKMSAMQGHAEEAIAIARALLSGDTPAVHTPALTRKEAAASLQISMDTLRNWEMNGLLNVRRKQNGYRMYTDEDMRRLKIIRSLRCANYSLSAILRMLHTLAKNPGADIRQVIDTPTDGDEIISVCDKLLTSLHCAAQNGKAMLALLADMKKQFCTNPTP